ncbi:ABC transporter permease [Flavonifractor sp. An92]|uniref:ABC transporter permease n=1 Tax=Flavonifractor sp. An92 TaxID=1965666 RepID=UPI001FA8CD1C|nr:ABC transporter permease [Flavonifractor sp. An92]
MRKRLLIYLVILFGVSIAVFVLMMSMPGDPYSWMLMDPNVDPAYVQRKLDELGLNDPIHIQYIKWLGRILHGDFGYALEGQATLDLVSQALKNTLLLTIPAFLLSTLFAVLLGIWSAMSASGNKILDRLVTLGTFLEVSIPTFFLALILIKWFGYDLKLLPVSGLKTLRVHYTGLRYVLDVAKHMILPVFVLTLTQTSGMLRYMRSAMIDILNQDYIRTAQAKGMTWRRAIWTHGLRNALISVITVFCMRLPGIISGALFTETVFVWPGIGTLNYNSILNRDYAVIITITMILAMVILATNLLADILYAVADPRIRLGGGAKE